MSDEQKIRELEAEVAILTRQNIRLEDENSTLRALWATTIRALAERWVAEPTEGRLH